MKKMFFLIPLFVFAVWVFAERTPRIGLREMMVGAANPDIIFNEAMYKIDALIFPMLSAYPASTDPSTYTPEEGDLYIVPAGAVGDWEGRDNNLAVYQNYAWEFITPKPGYSVMKSDGTPVFWGGASWSTVLVRGPMELTDEYESSVDQLLKLSDHGNTVYGPLTIYDSLDHLAAHIGLEAGYGVYFHLLDPAENTVFLVSNSSALTYSKHAVESAVGYKVNGTAGYSGTIPAGTSITVEGGIITGIN
ncbi:MAG: DUF2793 domain-containing protein [Candidatus Omnitrophica bacterium]|nr:DUF2793 domain-containing protein [Candidatus Omnitrophota bacterium]